MPPKIMMRNEFQGLAKLRAHEADILAKKHKQQGAYYLAGLAVECALKACIAKKTKRHQFPLGFDDARNVYSHKLLQLVKTANLETQLDSEIKNNPRFAVNWGVVKNWDVERRYDLRGLNGTDMVKAVISPRKYVLYATYFPRGGSPAS
jgi:hypothetical protein